MKRLLRLFTSILIFLFLTGCFGTSENTPQNKFTEFEYTHYTTGGVTETYTAVILFEQDVTTFTAYQVAFLSCTCRDPLANYLSVAYVEILNTKPTSNEAAIRSITFGNNMGLWGDSNPNYNMPEYTEEYFDEYFVQRLVRVTKEEVDNWEGYGKQLDCIDADAVTGATVSTSNITSMLKSLFTYHTEKYYTA